MAAKLQRAIRKCRLLNVPCVFIVGCCNFATVHFSLRFVLRNPGAEAASSPMMLSGDSTGDRQCITESMKSEIVGTTSRHTISMLRTTEAPWYPPRRYSTNGTSRSGRRAASLHALSRSAEGGLAAAPGAADLKRPIQGEISVVWRQHTSRRSLRAASRLADSPPRI